MNGEASLSLKATIRELLWSLDAAGVREHRAEAPEEYDGLVAGVTALIKADPTGRQAGEWLATTLRSDWGLVTTSEECIALVRRASSLAR